MLVGLHHLWGKFLGAAGWVIGETASMPNRETISRFTLQRRPSNQIIGATRVRLRRRRLRRLR
jgi:hypothetical protein